MVGHSHSNLGVKTVGGGGLYRYITFQQVVLMKHTDSCRAPGETSLLSSPLGSSKYNL